MASSGLLRAPAGSVCMPACLRAPAFSAACVRRSASHLRAGQRDTPSWGEEAPGTGKRHTACLLASSRHEVSLHPPQHHSHNLQACSLQPSTCVPSPPGHRVLPLLQCCPDRRHAAGLRHFPEQSADTPLEDDPQRPGSFEMRSTAEVYELFERLQQQQQTSQQRDGGENSVDFRKAAAFGGPSSDQPEDALRSGPLTGQALL